MHQFSKALLKWNLTINSRSLPWKNEPDVYKIWLSEILLQQTRADQVIHYYNSFIHNFPTIFDLANAPEQKIFKIWQGLGYYSRCRNMIATAKFIVENHNGVFPNTYDQILKLKGCGPYTASAIASFAFGIDKAVVDGNVYRVLSRYFGMAIAIDSTDGKKEFQNLATNLLPKGKSKQFNQAIMDFGASVCVPKNASCPNCPLNKDCIAFKNDSIALYPYKSKKILIKTRYFHYIIFKNAKHIYIQERITKDIWQNLYEFYWIETKDETIINKFVLNLTKKLVFSKIQKLTHQKIIANFYEVNIKDVALLDHSNLIKVKIDDLKLYAFPKIVLDYLSNKKYIKM